MSVFVKVPTPLRKYTDGQAEISAEATTVEELIDNLEVQYSGIKSRICDDAGKIRRFVNIYVNETDIRFMQGKETALADGDKVSVVPAIAGGRNN